MATELHLPENALALHLFLQRLKGLVDVIVANEYLHARILVKYQPSDGGQAGRDEGEMAGAFEKCP
jgi:hypothetical protein